MAGLRSFKELTAWQKAHELVLFVYKCTKRFPDEEKFGLTSQTRRAAVSVTSNIAEGFGRRTAQDKIHFYTMSKTSLAELQNQFLIAYDLHYISDAVNQEFDNRANEVDRLVAGLAKSATSKSSS